jgi:hypothetical protein
VADETNGGSDEYTQTGVVDNAASQTLYGKRPQTVNYPFTDDSRTALDVSLRSLDRLSLARGRVKCDVPLYGLLFDLTDLFRLTHFAGLALNGYDKRLMAVKLVEVDLDKDRVSFEAEDVSDLYNLCYALGDETLLPAKWPGTLSTGNAKCYGYLADEVTGTFAAGDPGKRLC